MTIGSPPTPAVGVPEPRISQRELLVMISAIMALMAVGIDLILPAFPEVRTAFDLGEGSNATGQLITVFFMGLAVSQLFYGPLTDRFGRKPILYVGITIYLLGAAGSALAPTFDLLLVSRFVWGVGAAGARVVAVAIVRDRFEGEAMAKAMSQIMAVFVLVPVFAPALGAAIIAVLPWRSIFWLCVLWASAVAMWSFRLRETLAPEHVRPISARHSWDGYVKVIRTPVSGGYMLASVFLQCVFTSYLASGELIIGEIFGRGSQFPFIFGVVALGFGAMAIVNGRVVERLGINRLMNRALVLQLPLTIVLVVVSVAADGRPNFWVFMPLMAAILALFMFLMPNLNTAAMTPVGDIAGIASAFGGAMRMAIGAVIGTIISNQVVDTVTEFAIGVTILCWLAAITIWVVQRRSGMRENVV